MNRFSWRSNRLKFKTTENLPIILEEFIEYTPNLIKEKWRMSTCNWLDLQTLGSQPVMPKILPDHCFATNYMHLCRLLIRDRNLFFAVNYFHLCRWTGNSGWKIEHMQAIKLLVDDLLEWQSAIFIEQNSRVWEAVSLMCLHLWQVEFCTN